MAILRAFRSYPGSGKSTAAKMMFPGVLLLENDQFLISDGEYKWSPERRDKAINLCINFVKTALANNNDCIVANTFTKRRYVDAYKKIAEDFGAKFEVYRCTGNFKNVHGLSDELVQKFKDAMEDYPGEIIVNPVDMTNANDSV